jgi:predicted dehydrogenase
MNLAIIGCGRIAHAHAVAITERSDLSLIAVVDPVNEQRRQFAEAYGGVPYDSILAMLTESPPDAACLCTPPAMHHQGASELLTGGVHVLCEKPLAISGDEAQSLVLEAERARRLLMASSKFRFVEDLWEARRRIESGKIGLVVHVEVSFCSRLPLVDTWHTKPELSGGGVIMDNGPHAYDVLSVLVGDRSPRVVAAAFGPPSADGRVEETAEIIVRLPDESVGRIALSWAYNSATLDYVHVHGSHGELRVGWDGGSIRGDGDEWEKFGGGYDKGEAFKRMLDRFVKAARGELEPEPLDRAVAAVRFVEAAYRVEPIR